VVIGPATVGGVQGRSAARFLGLDCVTLCWTTPAGKLGRLEPAHLGSRLLLPSACTQQLVHTLLLLNLQAGAFKIGDAAGTLDNVLFTARPIAFQLRPPKPCRPAPSRSAMQRERWTTLWRASCTAQARCVGAAVACGSLLLNRDCCWLGGAPRRWLGRWPAASLDFAWCAHTLLRLPACCAKPS